MHKTIPTSTGESVPQQAQTITEIRKTNKLTLKRAGTAHRQYISGAGYAMHVVEKRAISIDRVTW
jgi:hypothetical protein